MSNVQDSSWKGHLLCVRQGGCLKEVIFCVLSEMKKSECRFILEKTNMGILARDQSSVRHSARARDPPLPRPLLIHFFSCFLFPEVWFASCALMVRKILPHRLHSLCRRERLTWLDNWRKERMDRHEPAHIYLFLWTLRSKAVRIVFKISPLDIRNKLQRQFSFWEFLY